MDLSLGKWKPHHDWREDATGLWRLADPWGLGGAGTGSTAEVTKQGDVWRYDIDDTEPNLADSLEVAMFYAEAELVLAVRQRVQIL